MCYRDLYEFAQALHPPLAVANIRNKIPDLVPGRRVTTVELDVPKERFFGFYISHRNEDTIYYPNVRAGSAIIAISEHLDPEWKKFVELKELMHVLDDPLQATSTAKEFEDLLAGLCSDADPNKLSPQYKSEIECLWMALSLCCPETIRSDYQQRRENQQITDAVIAEELVIPERLVIHLCSDRYKANIQYLLDMP